MSRYVERLLIPIEGNKNTIFSTLSGLEIARGYERIVLGQRGPYIEFVKEELLSGSIFIPEDQKWRTYSSKAFYVELRTVEDFVKIYFQKRIVDYADYKIGFFYISPFDILADGKIIIKPLRRSKLND
jgi:hypothetical protein